MPEMRGAPWRRMNVHLESKIAFLVLLPHYRSVGLDFHKRSRDVHDIRTTLKYYIFSLVLNPSILTDRFMKFFIGIADIILTL